MTGSGPWDEPAGSGSPAHAAVFLSPATSGGGHVGAGLQQEQHGAGSWMHSPRQTSTRPALTTPGCCVCPSEQEELLILTPRPSPPHRQGCIHAHRVVGSWVLGPAGGLRGDP